MAKQFFNAWQEFLGKKKRILLKSYGALGMLIVHGEDLYMT